ncbi:sensor domain-containing diguanylate cyclase [Lacicoccus alkaliphilus]|uniref:PAS domain S-box-containing protein/diguanylate cyclase (GGDEF) domain-containing protein n=1 Tax=Lacicoccus alkaliphilus DSM 16010 TaxID=1123231 RepID=A0A1M7ASK5_9BACL|nr:PAS domain-containing protein [Salinicoccus alkaliphilus]SHL45606.1 PAS domain S-box-containing protein/diguanylate cyclase (GGDEF) domain-containing protein [Salinicoccus alkaliphilus DSM 16010]
MQSDTEYSREELIKEIDSLKRLNKELLDTFHETERLEFGWTGNLGQWFWDFTVNEVTYNPMKATALGYTKEELPEKVAYEFFTEKLHPDDYEPVMQMMRDHLEGKIPVWEVRYRIRAKDGSWKVYQDRGKVTERTEDGAPLFLKGIVFDVTEEEQEKAQLKRKNSKLRSQMRMDALTSLYARQSVLLELSYLKEREDPQSIIVLRIDDYAKYEEELGVVMSENILKTAGGIIRSAAGGNHFAGRYRETVFMILLDDVREEEAYAMAEEIRETVMTTVFEVPRDITVSGGVAAYIPGETVSELLQTVTEKLVAAQRQGGNQVIR